MPNTHETETSPASTSAPITGAPDCPTCGGRMWDNRATKRNPKAPDFKCRDRRCDGVVWPGEHHAAEPILAPPHSAAPNVEASVSTVADASEAPERSEAPSARVALRTRLRACYLDVTDFVLAEVRPKYAAAGVPCTDATVAAIAATLFIGLCKERGL